MDSFPVKGTRCLGRDFHNGRFGRTSAILSRGERGGGFLSGARLSDGLWKAGESDRGSTSGSRSISPQKVEDCFKRFGSVGSTERLTDVESDLEVRSSQMDFLPKMPETSLDLISMTLRATSREYLTFLNSERRARSFNSPRSCRSLMDASS